MRKLDKSKLSKEGKKWVEDEIISKQQLDAILSRYPEKEASNVLLIFATLLVSIAVLIFVFSDWAQVPHISRIILMLAFMTASYVYGNYIFAKKPAGYGVSFLLLAYIFFGATLYLTLTIYNVSLESVWPVIIWSIIGLGLFELYKHPYILFVGLIGTIFGQMLSSLAYSEVNFILLAVFLFGYFHFVYHYPNKLINYVFSIGLSIQLVIIVTQLEQTYYWMSLYLLVMYSMSVVMNKVELKRALLRISLLSVFILKIWETFLLQNNYYMQDFSIDILFIVILALVWIAILNLQRWRGEKQDIIDLLLFLPLFFLPLNYLFIIISMFIYSLYWLITSMRYQIQDRFMIGIIGFVLSVFTAYVQFAWEAMNKSLFFLIGGLILFVISFFFEKQRRSIDGRTIGDE